MAGRLEGKVAVITGGVSGMGLASVEMFVQEGARLVVADVQGDKGRALEQRFPGNVRFSQCDVRNEDDIAAAVDLAVSSFGELDVMYHNAGAAGAKETLEAMTVEGWDDTQALLSRSTALCIKHAVRSMKRRGQGSIILTSSVGATNLRAGTPAYSVAKGSVILLGRLGALEFAADRIRVNVLVPGGFATPIYGDLVGASREVADLMPEYLDEMMAQWQPLPRAGKAVDIAYAATYLASDESAFITGVALPVDGGLTLHRPTNASDFLFSHLTAAKEQAEAQLAARSGG
ncbi:SDR family NAD(P)-dependent oxidoreductase [Sphingobium mellinum]|uniref:SDR family NAD(P)-dependent oxidoreductase n=1 Tax=Sphingobium mellinum TaxID=1387166 RepID=UPI0030EB1EDB